MTEKKSKRTVRRIVEPPRPEELGNAREEFLKEALLNNTRPIRAKLVAWDLAEPLEVHIQVTNEIEGDLLADWYAERGYDVTHDDGVLTFDVPEPKAKDGELPLGDE